MKSALIATVYNEAANVERWWNCLYRQTKQPDEIVIVDGGSTDGTWKTLQQLARSSSMPVKLEQCRCNIAAGRNRAIQLTDADIITTTDAGSFPNADWFNEITKPLMVDKNIDMVGGCSQPLTTGNDFQRFLMEFGYEIAKIPPPGMVSTSARNSAFRRATWAAVGGYPEWLTLTAEDLLFNLELQQIGIKFVHNPRAVVAWEVRDSVRKYWRMLYSYGYGAAESRSGDVYFLRKWLVTICPPLLLLSPRRFQHLFFRYFKNAASALGWLDGKLRGHPAPQGWRRVNGVLLSPQAQDVLNLKSRRWRQTYHSLASAHFSINRKM
jgi:glycosyltransferase involved in cell wall biosynthesis